MAVGLERALLSKEIAAKLLCFNHDDTVILIPQEVNNLRNAN